MSIPHSLFEEKLEALKKAKGAERDTDLDAGDLKELVGLYKNVYVEAKGEQFPTGKAFRLCETKSLVLRHIFRFRLLGVFSQEKFGCSCRSEEAAVSCGDRCVRLMGQPQGEEVQEHQPDQGAPGNCGKCAVHGVWKHGGHLRDWSSFHAKPEHRREEALRGVPLQCSSKVLSSFPFAFTLPIYFFPIRIRWFVSC